MKYKPMHFLHICFTFGTPNVQMHHAFSARYDR